ncbi:MAG TPA: DUF6036 family nucleotidyltransferase [Candidatus Baltobacteraceae bacterium]|nr:DUF6036 family nucleotidyltransferase [Candidatus Baltobacteraceae bacterium]
MTKSSIATKFHPINGGTLRREEVVLCVLAAAEFIRSTEFVVIGSQALLGMFPDAPIDAVKKSIDVDLFPTNFRETMFIPLHTELGMDSDFFNEHGIYVDTVRPELARFPPDWRERASTQCLGEVTINDERRKVHAIFPEIHDLTVSKAVIGREQDKAFLAGVIRLGLVNVPTLEQRLQAVPRTTPERIQETLNEVRLISQAFAEGDAAMKRVKKLQEKSNHRSQ